MRNLLTLIGAMTVLHCLLFDISVVVSSSMSPTLRGNNRHNGDWVLSEKLTYRWRAPHRWELVQFTGDDDVGGNIMKRVVGLPGESIRLANEMPVIDARPTPPPASLNFLRYFAYGPYVHGTKTTLCGTGYFVLGDDSRDSFDSRFEGPLDPARITARPLLIIWPLSRFGWVNP